MATQKRAFIFIGKSGCGKGTQAELLRKTLLEKALQEPILYEETGALFREFITRENYTAQLSKKIMDVGARQPSFLAVLMWGNFLIEKLVGNEHVIFDGAPRALHEAYILDSALSFYGFVTTVIHVDISDEEAIRRLAARGRADDKSPEEVRVRLAWFEKDVVPALSYYRTHPVHTFIEVNGEAPIADVQAKLLKEILPYE